MSSIAIVTEYNPFHNGHKSQINKINKIFPDSPVICVMSGNFVQRGEPAVFDKYLRTKAALTCGISMVLELPVYYAASSAEFFAEGAVKILDSTGIVKKLCFGSESGDIHKLEELAEILINQEEKICEQIKKLSKSGLSYPRARQQALEEISPGCGKLISEPNNILGIEYIKAIKKQRLHLEFFASLREGAHYHSDDYRNELASATAIRGAIFKGLWEDSAKSVPENIQAIYETALNDRRIKKLNDFSQAFRYAVFSKGKSGLQEILDIDEGLENSIFSACEKYNSIEEILDSLKSKRYTRTRLSRVLIHILLDIRKNEFNEFQNNRGPEYIRVLGFRKDCAYLLKEMEEKSKLPVITNLKYASNKLSPLGMKMLEKEIFTSNIYRLTDGDDVETNEYKIPLVII